MNPNPRQFDGQPVNAAPAKMPEAEVARLLATVEALQGDLRRLIPSLGGKDSPGTLTDTHELLTSKWTDLWRSNEGQPSETVCK